MKVYILSGLGADERVFHKINFYGLKPLFINYIPVSPKESIENYAMLLSKQISGPDPVLIGLSFGGIMAIEIAKLIEVEKVIIISSIKTKYEMPKYFRFAGLLKLHRLLSKHLLKQVNFITAWFFGVSNHKDKQLLQDILSETDNMFLKWSIDKIIMWENKVINSDIIHIHGTKDRILPIRYVNANYKIKGGGHLMILNNSSQISEILEQLLEIKSKPLPNSQE